MKRLLSIALLFVLAGPVFAALPAGVVWEIESGGNDLNGGGFVAGASGTDRSQSTGAFCSATDLVLVTTTTATSVTCPFSSTSPGNLIQISAGTNCTAGFYQVVSVASVTATLDRVAGTTGCTAGTFRLGGALALPNKPCASLTTGNTVYVKAAIYTVTTSCSLGASAQSVQGTAFIGYTSSRGDNGQATWTTATNTNPLIIHTGIVTGLKISNFIFTNTASTRSTAIANSGSVGTEGWSVQNSTFDGFSTAISLRQALNLWLYHVEIKNSTNASSAALICGNANNAISGCTLYDVWMHDNAGDDILENQSGQMLNILSSVIGPSTGDGVKMTIQSSSAGEMQLFVLNSVFKGHSNAIEATSSVVGVNVNLINSVFYGATTALNFSQVAPNYSLSANVAFGGNTTDRNGYPSFSSDIALTVDPFVNASSGNYALNNKVGGGMLLRGKGYGALLTGTSFPDVGAIRHRDPKFKIGF